MKISNKKNIFLLLLAAIIAITPLIIKGNSHFEGSDSQGEELILEINPSYEIWSKPLWEPPSGEVESMLFSIQVAIGAGTIGFILGSFREKKKIAINR